MPAADAFFASDYHEARARFLIALGEFERHVNRRFERTRVVVDAAADLSIDIAELTPPDPERLYVVVSGIHGVEGYAGSAIQQALLASALPFLDLERSGLLLVHALNPVGMFQHRRVNASNVDLNRNFDFEGGELYASPCDDYAKIASLLEPSTSCDPGMRARLAFLAGVASAVRRHGFTPLRQATLGGQYSFDRGVFFGGRQREPETQAFQTHFEHACAKYPEVLLTDLHTGYGAFTQVSSLFGRIDSPNLQALIGQGVRDRRGRDQAYVARGDLVGWSASAAKRVSPACIFNGVVVELGTHGLGTVAQLDDLFTVVCENQVHHHGAASPGALERVRTVFRELFNPDDPQWRKRVLSASIDHIQALLIARGFLAR